MLSQRFGVVRLEHLLRSRQDWHPFPRVDERAAWNGISAGLRRSLIEAGENRLDFAWPHLPATRFLDFARTGDRSRYQDLSYARRDALADLVLAECAEGQGRFLDDCVNGIWALCEETYWGVPAHIGVQKAGSGLPDVEEPTVDLFAAETGALLAWTLYLLHERLDTVSPLVRRRMELEIRRRILDVLRVRIDFFWMGWLGGRRVNNWNPWICSNWLTCILAIEDDVETRAEDVFRVLRTVDNFIDTYPRDGGCDEGPNYWGRAGASLFENLELLYTATDGAVDVYGEPLIGEIGRFLHRAHIADSYYLNFADASALVEPEALLVHAYGSRIGDADMQAYARWLADRQGIGRPGLHAQGQVSSRGSSLGRSLMAIFALDKVLDQPGQAPLPRDVWLPDIEVMTARDAAGSQDGFYVAIKGGHNEESHNHNDIGNFVVYLDGRPLLVDAGVENYTAKTFSAQRYDIWTMQSAYHTLLPTIDGHQQLPGAQHRARRLEYAAGVDTASLSLEIAGAWGEDAGLDSWHRALMLHRDAGIDVHDRWRFRTVPASVQLSFLTPGRVELDGNTVRIAARNYQDDRWSAAGNVEFDAGQLTASVETVPIPDQVRMGPCWGTELYRVVFTLDQPAQEGLLVYGINY